MNKDDRKILNEQADRLQKYMDDLPCDLSDEESEVQNIIESWMNASGTPSAARATSLRSRRTSLKRP